MASWHVTSNQTAQFQMGAFYFVNEYEQSKLVTLIGSRPEELQHV